MRVGIANPGWRGKRSWHSQTRNGMYLAKGLWVKAMAVDEWNTVTYCLHPYYYRWNATSNTFLGAWISQPHGNIIWISKSYRVTVIPYIHVHVYMQSCIIWYILIYIWYRPTLLRYFMITFTKLFDYFNYLKHIINIIRNASLYFPSFIPLCLISYAVLNWVHALRPSILRSQS